MLSEQRSQSAVLAACRQRKPLELKPRSGTSDASGAPPTAPGSGRPPTPPQPSADAAAPAAATPSPGQKDAETRCKSLVTEYSQLKSDSEAIAAFQVRTCSPNSASVPQKTAVATLHSQSSAASGGLCKDCDSTSGHTLAVYIQQTCSCSATAILLLPSHARAVWQRHPDMQTDLCADVNMPTGHRGAAAGPGAHRGAHVCGGDGGARHRLGRHRRPVRHSAQGWVRAHPLCSLPLPSTLVYCLSMCAACIHREAIGAMYTTCTRVPCLQSVR